MNIAGHTIPVGGPQGLSHHITHAADRAKAKAISNQGAGLGSLALVEYGRMLALQELAKVCGLDATAVYVKFAIRDLKETCEEAA